MKNDVCVIIPTYGNGSTIVDVVTRTMAQSEDVIVVCDGCIDDTVSLLDSMKDKPVIIELERNCGKGAALKTGFRYALEAGYSYAITLDGDGQHFPEDIPVMMRANRQHPDALIVGERKNLENVDRSGGSKLANKLSNYVVAFYTGCSLRDTQTGYRLYPLRVFGKINWLPARYKSELLLLVWSSWRGIKLHNVLVDVYYPPGNERITHYRVVADTVRIVILCLILLVAAVVYGWPVRMWRHFSDFF